MHLKFVALSSALLAAGCVSAVPEADTAGKEGCAAKTAQAEADAVQVDEDRDPTMFAARAGGTSLVLVKVDGNDITGPNVLLSRYHEEEGRAIRGQARGSLVDLRIENGAVSGQIDNFPVNLTVERRGNKLDVAGLIPGRVSRYQIDEEGMRGMIGSCQYDLQRAGAGFTGRRACGGSVGFFTLELPDTMASWSDADVAAVFAIFLRKT